MSLNDPIPTPENTGNQQKADIKTRLKLTKHKLILFLISLVIFGLLTGIYVMGDKDNRKIQGIWMKVPFQNTKPTATGTPIPSIVPTIDPTSNWPTYSNKSVSFKYPSRFTVTDLELPYTVLYPKVYSAIKLTDSISTINITTAKNQANFSLETIIGSGPSARYAPSLLTSGKKNILINNITGITAESIPAGKEGIAKDVIFISKGKVYQLTLSPIDADTTTFDLILSTFKMLNQEPSDITDNWQVYTNSTYGYTLKYPTNYSIDHLRSASVSAQTIVSAANQTSTDSSKFKIEAQDIRNIALSNITSRNLLGLPLDQYVNKKWEYNKASSSASPNKIVSAIKETNIAGKIAFEFSVTQEFRDDMGTEKLSQEYLFKYLENGGYKFKIWYPKNDVVINDILKTITFYK